MSGLASLPVADDLDIWRLAGIVIPGLGRGERGRLARELGITLSPVGPASLGGLPAAEAREVDAILNACRSRLAALDLRTLQQLAQIFAGSRVPEARLVEEVFHERALGVFDSAAGGTSSAASGSGSAVTSAARPDQTASGVADDLAGGREVEGEVEGELGLAQLSGVPPALQPVRRRKVVDQNEIQQAFSPGGSVDAAFPGYELRAGQMKMARAVTKALNERLHLMVEAGTGTGKSLAYLLPAAEYAARNGRRVVVSTNTINLQEQLFFKDIPLLRRALPIDFRVAVLKGRANYLCLRRWRSFLREALTGDAERLFAAQILLWLAQTQTGDRSELALDDFQAARWAAALAADALHCTPQTCRDHRRGRCFLARARRQAEAAHLLVVNHALLLADQALESKVLPEYADLILDEAHHIEDAATKQLGVEIDQQEMGFFLATLSQQQGPGRYAGLVARVQTVLITAGGALMRSQAGELTQPAHDAVEEARRQLQEFFLALNAFVRAIGEGQPGGERDIRLTPVLRTREWWAGVALAWEAFGAGLGRVEASLARLGGALEPFKGSAELVDDALVDLAGAQRDLTERRLNLSAIVGRSNPDAVDWLSVGERGLALRSAPLDVGTLLREQLFSQKECVVFTSATLQVGGSFRYMRERLGLEASTFTLAVPSSFDYAQQALLCVPHDVPEPAARAFPEASHEALVSICEATGGRTLILFTSHAALRAAHERLRWRLRRLVVLGQGLDGPRLQLLDRFRETPGCVLLGTSSFWEGIDVVGDALSCLVIVKLPFSVPSDPLFAARSELFEDPFSAYAVPQAVLRLKQGFGRLIRSRADRGVVVVLDSRLWTKRYGAVFLRSLPPATQRRCSWREVGPLAQSWLSDSTPPAIHSV